MKLQSTLALKTIAGRIETCTVHAMQNKQTAWLHAENVVGRRTEIFLNIRGSIV